MKTLLILLFIIFLFSCEKDETTCWVCKVETTTMIDYLVVGYTSVIITPCGIVPEEIFAYEAKGTCTEKIDFLQIGMYGFNNVTTVKTTNCKKR